MPRISLLGTFALGLLALSSAFSEDISLTIASDYFIAEDRSLSLEDALALPNAEWKRPKADREQVGLIKREFWLRIPLAAIPVEGGRDWYLTMNSPFINEATLFQCAAEGTWGSSTEGRATKRSASTLGNTVPTFHLASSQGSAFVFLRNRTVDSVTLDIHAQTGDSLITGINAKANRNFLIFRVFFILAAFGCTQAILSRTPSFLYFTFFAFFYGLYFMAINGYFSGIFHALPLRFLRSQDFHLSCASMATFSLFTWKFLENPERRSRMEQVIYPAISFLSVIFFIGFLAVDEIFSLLFWGGIFEVLSLVTILLLVGRRAIMRHRYAWLYLASFAPLLVSVILTQFNTLKLLRYDFEIASISQIAFFGFGIVMKSRELQRERIDIESLRRSNEELERISRAKTQFFARSSHELRSPITLIAAPLEAIQKGRFGDAIDKNAAVFGIMRRNTERLKRLADGLLNVLRLEAGAVNVQAISIDLGPYIQTMAEEFLVPAGEK
ncbi:MAG: 7TM diverse intracellular signaling domain-containing protein, partial [Spirochaetota bacterium]